MPEGHTLHRLAGSLTRTFAGEVVGCSSLQERFAATASRLDGRRLRLAEAYGKHLFVHFDGDEDDEVVHVHLGLYGKFPIFRTGSPAEPYGALRWRITGATAYADLRGPTACVLLGPGEEDAVLERLGPDPLREDADPARAGARVMGSRSPVATLLMDQKVLAGVGNVYRAEVLFRHGIDPFMEGRYLRPAEWDALWDDLVTLMHEGVRTGRIDTVREADLDALATSAPLPGRRRRGGRSYVYRRQGLPCLLCGTPVRTREHVGRNLFWCPTCQPRSRRTRPTPRPRTR